MSRAVRLMPASRAPPPQSQRVPHAKPARRSAQVPLIDLAFEGARDLASRSFAAYLVGEGAALAWTAAAVIRPFPLATLIHFTVSLGWIYALWAYGAPAWRKMGLWADESVDGNRRTRVGLRPQWAEAV